MGEDSRKNQSSSRVSNKSHHGKSAAEKPAGRSKPGQNVLRNKHRGRVSRTGTAEPPRAALDRRYQQFKPHAVWIAEMGNGPWKQ